MDITLLRTELEDDISLRISNIATIRTMPSRYGFTEGDKNAIIRCAFPIIYSEWEGFFVHAMSLYIREINKLGLTLDQLDEKYFVNNAEKSFKQLKEYPQKFNQQRNFIYKLQDYFRNTGSVNIRSEINTESNLGFNVMNNILELFRIESIDDHLDHDAYSLKSDMDSFLLSKRNGIAHGDPAFTITDDDITSATQLVIRLFEEIKERILTAAQNEVYKK